jgi:hypothetical protein
MTSISRAIGFYNVRVQFVSDFGKRRTLASGLAAQLNKFSRRVGVQGPHISEAVKRVHFNCRSAIEVLPIQDHDALNALLSFATVLERMGQTAANSVVAFEKFQSNVLSIKGLSRDLNASADFLHSTMEGICAEIRKYREVCNELFNLAQTKAGQDEVVLASLSGFPSPQLLPDTPAGTPQ